MVPAQTTLTFDVGTIILLVVNIGTLMGAYYQLSTAISLIKQGMDQLRREVAEQKQSSAKRGETLDKLVTTVAVMKASGEHGHGKL